MRRCSFAPFADGEPIHRGTLGADVTVMGGQRAAEAVMMSILRTLKAESLPFNFSVETEALVELRD